MSNPLTLPDPDDKSDRGTPNTSGGGGFDPPSPGGWGGFGGGGLFPSDPGGLGFNLSPQRRLGGNAVMQMAGGGYDTIPAMLSPGEFVVNSQAAADPAIAQLLMALNQQGGQGMAGGGYVDERGNGLHPAILQLLTHLHAMAGGGFVGNYAGGGFANFNSPMPAMGANTTPTMQRQKGPQGGAWGGQQSGGGQSQQIMPWGQIGGGMTQTQSPANTGFNGDTGGTFGSGTGTGQLDNGFIQGIYKLLGGYNDSGAFGAGGSSQYMNALSGQAKSNADALTQRAMLGADVYGQDPSQAGATRLQALMGTNKDAGDAMTGAYAGLLGNQQQLAQSILGQMLGLNTNNVAGQQSYQWNKLLTDQSQGGGSGLAGTLGSVAGGALGAWLSPGGLWGKKA